MTESLTSRVSRLISAGVNMLVESVEDDNPELVVEETLRELGRANDDIRGEMGKAIARKHLASTRSTEANRRHEDLAEKVAIALEQGRDDLAEAAIAQQMDIEAQTPVLEHAVDEAETLEKELGGYIAALQGKQRELQEELQHYRRSKATGDAEAGAAVSGSSAEDAVRRAESAYDHVMESATGLPNQSESADPEFAAKIAELEEMVRADRIKERLAAAKASLKGD